MNENCYILTSGDESVIIDPGEVTSELTALVGRLNVKYILLTHGHFDHIGALSEIKNITSAKVCIHKNDAGKLLDASKSLAVDFGYPNFTVPEADILLSEGDTLTFGSEKIRVMETPGHTSGSVCFITDKDIFSGDTLFCLTYGRTDFPDGDTAALVASIDRLMALEGNYTVHPGHNRDTDLDTERIQNRYSRLRKYL